MSSASASTNYAIDWGLPCCQSQEPQTKVSLVVRVALILIGLTLIVIGHYYPMSSQFSWSLMGIGAFFTLAGIFLRCVLHQAHTSAIKWNEILVDPSPKATSWLPKLNTSPIHTEYSRIYICPLNDSPYVFFTEEGSMYKYKEEIEAASKNQNSKMLLIIWPQNEETKKSCRSYGSIMITGRQEYTTMSCLDVAFLYSSGTTWIGGIDSELTDILEGKNIFAPKSKNQKLLLAKD